MGRKNTYTPGRRRSFSHTGAAWYRGTALGGDLVDSVSIMLSDLPNDGVVYEFAIRWERLAGSVLPRLGMFDSAWLAFAECADLFVWLSTQHDARVSPEAVVEALIKMGFVDETARVES